MTLEPLHIYIYTYILIEVHSLFFSSHQAHMKWKHLRPFAILVGVGVDINFALMAFGHHLLFCSLICFRESTFCLYVNVSINSSFYVNALYVFPYCFYWNELYASLWMKTTVNYKDEKNKHEQHVSSIVIFFSCRMVSKLF